MFHERWFQSGKPAKYRQALSHVPDSPGELVEVGVWEGKSTIICAREFPTSRVHAIDHWKGDLTDPRSGVAQIAASRDVFMDFLENIRVAGVSKRIVIHRDDWRTVFAHWKQPIRMLFIDGEHTYVEVADNIEAAMPFLVPGAVLCGDDYSVKGVGEAVHEKLDDIGDLHVVRGGGAVFWYWIAPGRVT